MTPTVASLSLAMAFWFFSFLVLFIFTGGLQKDGRFCLAHQLVRDPQLAHLQKDVAGEGTWRSFRGHPSALKTELWEADMESPCVLPCLLWGRLETWNRGKSRSPILPACLLFPPPSRRGHLITYLLNYIATGWFRPFPHSVSP